MKKPKVAGGNMAIIAMCFMLALSGPSIAGVSGGQDPGELIKIIGVHLEGRLDEDPQSGYNQLIEALLPKEDHYFTYKKYPIARAIRDFAENKRVCMYPTSKPAVQILTNSPGLEIDESEPIDIVSAHVINKRNNSPFGGIEELMGKSIAVQQGVVATQFIKSTFDTKIIRTPNDLTALKMVLADRVDAMYGWFPDTFIIAEKNQLSLPHFNPDFILFKTTTHLVCKKFDGSERLFKIVNTRITDLKHRGKLREILGKHARIAAD